MKIDTHPIGVVKAVVPFHPKGGRWVLVERKILVHEGETAYDAQAFAWALCQSYVAWRKKEDARPAPDPGLVLVGGGYRRRRDPDLDRLVEQFNERRRSRRQLRVVA
jgi:hypothetical protein